jgi:hypothetical protein
MVNSNKVYVVELHRSDLPQPIELLVGNTEEAAKDELERNTKEWIESTKEQRPFIMSAPFESRFVPGLIKEIRVLPMTLEQYQERAQMWHQQSQMTQGVFDRMMSNNGRG